MNPTNVSQPSSAPSTAASSGTGSLKDKAAETTRKVSETVREKASDLKTAAADSMSRVKDEAGHLATEQKQRAADHIGGYSTAAHEAAKSLESEDPNIAWFAHRAADRLQGLADYVRQRDFTALRSDAENIARRHPAAFFGGMFLAGLVLGNVLKARRPSPPNEEFPASGDFDPERSYASSSMDEPAPYGASAANI